MKKVLLLLFAAITFITLADAQNIEKVFTKTDLSPGLINANDTDVSALFGEAKAPFVTLAATADLAAEVLPTDFSVMFFYETKNNKFNFTFLKQDTHADPDKFVSKLFFLPPDAVNFRFKVDKNKLTEGGELKLHFYNPGHTQEREESASERVLEDCNCPQPEFQERLDWCPTGDCPIIENPVITDVSHLIVHHSAGVNTSSDWAATVRGIWNFHVNTNGWDDIGYNWLIDPNGLIYEGRGDNVRGAHFCGNNTNTQGVCMLGTYIDETPTEAAMETLTEYLAWKSANDNIDPTAIAFHSPTNDDVPNVAGHRDGCSTTCPGDALYAEMPQLRTDIRQYQARICGHPHSTTDLTAVQQSPDLINLTWTDNAETEDSYLVQRAVGNGSFSTIATLAADSEVYADLDFEGATTYRYQVLSVAEGVESTCHLEVEITTEAVSNNTDILSASEVKISPNPTTSETLIRLQNELRGMVNLELSDVTGRVLQTQKNRKTEEILDFYLDLTDFPAAVYFIKVKAENTEGTFRLLKH